MGKVKFLLLLFCWVECNPQAKPKERAENEVVVGVQRLDLLMPMLQSKRVGLLVNQTSVVGKTHLVDTLLTLGVNVRKIFAPEHGFRGKADAGETINDSIDTKTWLPIISLYGNSKKPKPEHLADIDVIVFDMQDVGARFFTYISTAQCMLEACAENDKTLIILDRPNPNGNYVDGPVMQRDYISFVGLLPIPIVHGMTIGELALLSNGEGWLAGKRKCKLEIIPVKNWKHSDSFSLPIKPSPNLPNDQAIKLYPSICLFEGTVISVGRGTQNPFQVIGHPDLKDMPYQFTPISIEGMAKKPVLENKLCNGLDLRMALVKQGIDLQYLIKLYNAFPDKDNFFNSYFDKLAGNSILKEQIKKGMSEDEIKATWLPDLVAFKALRKKYLLYP